MHKLTLSILAVAAVTFPAISSVAQEPGRGMLLISTEALSGTLFEETVMLIVHHDDDGSIGIMINRPTTLAPAQVYPDVEGAGSYTGVVYFGGPLAPGRPFLLSRRSQALEGASLRIVEDVYLSADAAMLNALDEVQRTEGFARLYAGNAQWGPGQLVGEIEAGAWEIALASAGMVFTTAPEALWRRLLDSPRGTDIVRAPHSEAPSDVFDASAVQGLDGAHQRVLVTQSAEP